MKSDQELAEAMAARPAMFRKAPPDPEWPLPGDILTHKGTHAFWFTDIIGNAKDNLVVGKKYRLKTIKVLSSWCCITLEETGDKEYSLSFFTY
jgi:hypothetical protein